MTAGTRTEQANGLRMGGAPASGTVEGNMLCALLGAVASPEGYGITWRDGELFIEPSQSVPSPTQAVDKLAA